MISIHLGVSIDMGVPQNGWFKRENPIEMDDLGVPRFQETIGNPHLYPFVVKQLAKCVFGPMFSPCVWTQVEDVGGFRSTF